MSPFYVSVVVICLLITFAVLNLIHFRKLPPELIEFENKTIPKQTKIKSNDINVPAPRVACMDNTTLYKNLPKATIQTTVPVPNSISFLVDNAKVCLLLSNNGNLEYFLDDVLVWTSEKPHSYTSTLQVKVMLEKFVDKVIASTDELSLHIYPLRITYKDRLLWGFWGGFDATSFCSENDMECLIPIQEKDDGVVFLFSDNRTYRASLHENGDLIVMSASADSSNMFQWVKKIDSSLIQEHCKE